MENKGKYYITTAIAYASRKPHIGNTYEIVLSDAIARYKRAQGYDVFFCTGTDEHGQKIETLAGEAGITPQEYVAEILRHTYRDATLTDAEKIARVKEVYDRLDIPRLTEQQISLRFERALATLDSLSADPARTLRMREFAEGLMGRKK